jgi:predicted ATP-grasp superfamily ATP-dependent carboligase
MTRIMLTGAGGSAAYNFRDALALDNPDHYVVGVDMKPYHLELIDVAQRYLVPGVNDPTYVEVMNRVIEKEKIEFFHPQPDPEVAFLARNRDKIQAKTFLPDADAIELCHDKMAFNERMSEAGVAVPQTYRIDKKDDLKQALQELLKVQPKIWLRASRGAGSRASLPINSFYQGDAWIDYWRNFRGIDYGDFMASEFLPGHEFAWQSLWYEGELITAQARERIEYIFGALTPSGQTSSPSVAKTVNRADLDETCQAAVRAVSKKPHGVYCVDLKEDASGVPKVTEINIGRFFTTSNFFAHAGLNMPAMYLELAMTGKLKEKPKQLNPLEDDLYWVRMIDMGYKLVKGDAWSSQKA